MKVSDVLDYDRFYEMFITNNMTLPEIAGEYGVTVKQLSAYNRRHWHIDKPKSDVQAATKRINLAKYGTEYPQRLDAVKNKSKKTCIERYGVENGGGSEAALEKIRQTNLERYGVECAFQRDDVKRKAKDTMIERYGVEHPLQKEEFVRKMKDTCVERYGAESYLSNPDIFEEYKKENLEKYGVEIPMLSESASEKREHTIKERYGVDKIGQSPAVIEKRRQTMIERYGAESNLSTADTRNKIRQTVQSKYGVPYHCMTAECRNAASHGPNSGPNIEFAKMLEGAGIAFEKEAPFESKVYDFAVGDTLIEIDPTWTHNSDGNQWTATGLPPDYHMLKTQLAIKHGKRCIHVWDWDDRAKIIAMIGDKTPIMARKCAIGKVPPKQLADFLNANHLQGNCRGQKIALGLYDESGGLVEVMTFGKPRYSKKHEYELLRLCTKSGVAIRGGAQRMFKAFVAECDPKSIISYCDNSKFSGSVYQDLGMELIDPGKPARHWHNIKTGKHITDNLLRQRGFDQLFGTDYGKGASNDELMRENGFLEIYDCGQSAYEWKNVTKGENNE